MPVNKVFIVILFVLSGCLGLGLSLLFHQSDSRDDTQTIQVFHYPTTFVKQLAGDRDAPRKIFKEFCATCHNNPPLIDVPAPRIDDQAAWRNLSQLGGKKLLAITINGLGAMPARGGCFECTDEQLQETIHYMMHYSAHKE